MKRIKQLTLKYFAVALIMISCKVNYAQLSAPVVESVYGGRINAITGYALTVDTTRIFISTESANSIFYTDVAHSGSPSAAFFAPFKVMPGADANAAFGSGIQILEAHPQSGKVFFAENSSIYSTHPNSTTVDTINTVGFVKDILIVDSTMIFIADTNIHFGKLDNNGNFTEDAGSPKSISTMDLYANLAYSPIDSILYVVTSGFNVGLYQSTDKFDQLNSSSSFTDISPSSLSTSVYWRILGIAPSGRLFIAGLGSNAKQIAYSDDGVTWTSYTAYAGAWGTNFAFSGDSSSYNVYYASIFNDNNGLDGSWKIFGSVNGIMTHPNDGAVFVDPNKSDVVYLTTDQGIGASEDGGKGIFEIDDGVEALQVNDFSMTPSKNTAWLASKSGIRRVRDYRGLATWSNALFPWGDGSPYYSAEMSHYDSTVAYVGNLRVYKTTDDGNNWTRSFTPELAPYNFTSIGTKCNAIEECPWDSSIVFAGFEIEGTDKGGLFYSMDEGTTWDQLLLEASADGADVDVNDIIFNIEGTDTVVYVGVGYDLSAPQGWSVYKITKSGSSWSAALDMTGSSTSTGASIVVTIMDLELSATGDTVYAAGTDAGNTGPYVYYKPLSATGLWTPMSVAGFNSSTFNQTASSVTVSGDTVFVAVSNEIYNYVMGVSTSWTLGYSYPVGTKINFLYYDELLAGTSTGLYAHFTKGGVTTVRKDENPAAPKIFALDQNYPNPFNPSTTIGYILPRQSNVSLKIYNILGKEIAELVNKNQAAGKYSVSFDASSLSSGIFFYTLRTGGKTLTKKMILLK